MVMVMLGKGKGSLNGEEDKGGSIRYSRNFHKIKAKVSQLAWTDVGHLGPEILGTSVLPDFGS